ncbi:MFS transporter, partial [Streptomyces sp. NPDC059142]
PEFQKVLGATFLFITDRLAAAHHHPTPHPAYLGRVTSVSTLVTLGIAPLCYPVVGAAVGLWGAGPVFLACAAICASGGVIGLCSTPLRRAELPH